MHSVNVLVGEIKDFCVRSSPSPTSASQKVKMISKLSLKTKCFTCRSLNMLKGEDKISRREAFNFFPTRLQRENAADY